jgi:antirestriction protein
MVNLKRLLCSHNCSHDIYYIKFYFTNNSNYKSLFAPVYKRCLDCGLFRKNILCSYEHVLPGNFTIKEEWVKHTSDNLDLSFLDFYPFIRDKKGKYIINGGENIILGEVNWDIYQRELKLKAIIERT